jgi:D-alanyl-D-alanine carboxypeptidase (penicillin-binding protein 5/6)
MLQKKTLPQKQVLGIKRGVIFAFGLILFLFPGQNWIIASSDIYEKPLTRVGPQPFSLADYPLNSTSATSPLLTARAIAVVDKDSMVMVSGKNEKESVLPASTVKIMTGLVALDSYKLDDYLVVKGVDNYGQDMDLEPGEIISVKNLLYGVLVASANDAALVLADNFPGGQKNFVKAMNRKAKELNLNNTYFANPTGLDSDEEDQLLTDFSYTTALDLARLSAVAIKNPIFSQMVDTKSIEVSDVTGRLKHPLYNVNQLLGAVEGMRGVKTGWTQDAGECLVSFVERDGRGVIFVVLGSQDRFGETKKLVDWFFSNYRWVALTPTI